MNPNSPYLSIVVPLFNEEESLAELHEEIISVGKQLEFSYEIILVDDGSTDGTWAIIEELKKMTPQLRAIKFRRNFGQTSAMVAGFDYSKGDVIVSLDGDLQNDPRDIPLLLEKISEGYDVVSGWRIHRKDHFTRVLPSKLANSIISLTTGVRLHDYGCALKAYRAVCIKSIKAYGEMHRFFPALAKMAGSRIIELPVRHRPRKYGDSKYGLNRIFKVLSDIIAINLITKFSSNPLKGFIFSALPFFWLSAFFCVVVAVSLIFQWAPGKSLFFLVASALNLVAAIHLVTLGVLGELVINTSDLTHTQLPEINKRVVVPTEDESNKHALN